jgi:hypothetical protein
MANWYMDPAKTNLSPEELAWLQTGQTAMTSSGYQAAPQIRMTSGSGDQFTTWYPNTGISYGDSQDFTGYGDAQGYSRDVAPGSTAKGDWSDVFDTNGVYKGTSQRDNSATKELIAGLLMAVAAPVAGGALAGAVGGTAAGGAAAGGAAGGAGAAGAGSGALVGSSAGMVAPAGLGAAAGGTGLWGPGAASVLGGAAGAGAGAGAAVGSSGGMSAPAGLGAASGGTGLWGPGATATGAGGSALGGLTSMLPEGSSSLLGPAATLAGAASGAQGQEASQTSERRTDPRVDPYLFGGGGNPGLLGYTQQQLAQQMAPGGMAGYDQMQSVGRGLLGTPVAGNGTGAMRSAAEYGGQSNPWMSSVADEIGRRTQEGLGQSFNQIRSNAVGVGGLGGSRQAIAEGNSIKGAMDSMQGQLVGLYGQDWTNSQNRGLTERGQDMSFYGQQRGQDLAQVGMGSDLYSRGVQGGWAPLQNASSIFNSTAGNNVTSTSGSNQGGGWGGALGGALAGASLGRQMNWW